MKDTVVLWGNFSYPNAVDIGKKFYHQFTSILCNTDGLAVNLSAYPSKIHQDAFWWICTNSYLNIFLRRWGGCLPYPNAVGDRWGLTTPLEGHAVSGEDIHLHIFIIYIYIINMCKWIYIHLWYCHALMIDVINRIWLPCHTVTLYVCTKILLQPPHSHTTTIPT